MLYIICKNCLRNQLFRRNIFQYFTVKQYSINLKKHYKFKCIGSEHIKLADIIQKYEDNLLYSGYVELHSLKLGYKRNVIYMEKRSREENKHKQSGKLIEPLPLSLKYICNNYNTELNQEDKEKIENVKEKAPAHFPFDIKERKVNSDFINFKETKNEDVYKDLADLEIKERLKYMKVSNWMSDYDNYEETALEEVNNWKINYGTPDPNSTISNAPCGGCGALLHCKDTSIPGYIPSEIYKNHTKKGGTALQAIICQRCYFLKNHNLALQVQVSPEDYPQVLKTIKERDKALIILIVDLLDFPCSIWPGAADLLGSGRPIILVGNKVDLLPQDAKGFLERVSQNLKSKAKDFGYATADIKHVCLISAVTGFGVEDLITKLHSYWGTKGDVFLVGCTNVGKSSLFNALLQSDYCKSQASDLIHKATVSPWPGTTLNLLKFPILRLSGHRAYMRYQRLVQNQKQIAEEKKLRKIQFFATKKSKFATLIGHIGRTFTTEEPIVEGGDMFSVKGHQKSSAKINIGINENEKAYSLSKWCYDTPGVVQPEQLLHLLTTEELLTALPKELIRPKTFCLQPGSTIFIGGLSRLDYLEGKPFARFTVFCSHGLPITICKTSIAFNLYEELLGTEFFAVPFGNSERLKFWPGLEKSKEFIVKGIDWNHSCADIVLSSSGWIAIAGKPEVEYQVKAWTPKHCGIYLRESLLPGAVSLRGKRVRDSPVYRSNKFYMKS